MCPSRQEEAARLGDLIALSSPNDREQRRGNGGTAPTDGRSVSTDARPTARERATERWFSGPLSFVDGGDRMTYPMTDEDRAIQETARRFVDGELIPHEVEAEMNGGEIEPA